LSSAAIYKLKIHKMCLVAGSPSLAAFWGGEEKKGGKGKKQGRKKKRKKLKGQKR